MKSSLECSLIMFTLDSREATCRRRDSKEVWKQKTHFDTTSCMAWEKSLRFLWGGVCYYSFLCKKRTIIIIVSASKNCEG